MLPGGPELVTIYCCAECGCPCQQIVKDPVTFTRDLVWDFEHDDAFVGLRRITEPRGNDPAVVGGTVTPEIIATQTPRTWSGANAALRDAYSTFVYYDHMSVGTQAELDRSFFDFTQEDGKFHGRVPRRVPREWTPEQVRAVRDVLRESVKTRGKMNRDLGVRHPRDAREPGQPPKDNHGTRLAEEERS